MQSFLSNWRYDSKNWLKLSSKCRSEIEILFWSLPTVLIAIEYFSYITFILCVDDVNLNLRHVKYSFKKWYLDYTYYLHIIFKITTILIRCIAFAINAKENVEWNRRVLFITWFFKILIRIKLHFHQLHDLHYKWIGLYWMQLYTEQLLGFLLVYLWLFTYTT